MYTYTRVKITSVLNPDLSKVSDLTVPQDCSLAPRAAQTGTLQQLILRDPERRISNKASHWSKVGGSTNQIARNIFSLESSEPNLNLWCNGWFRNDAQMFGSSFFQISQH